MRKVTLWSRKERRPEGELVESDIADSQCHPVHNWREFKVLVREERLKSVATSAARDARWLGPTTWVVPAVGRIEGIAISERNSPSSFGLSSVELRAAVALGIYSTDVLGRETDVAAEAGDVGERDDLEAQFSLMHKISTAISRDSIEGVGDPAGSGRQ